jgi:hypothetical protein
MVFERGFRGKPNVVEEVIPSRKTTSVSKTTTVKTSSVPSWKFGPSRDMALQPTAQPSWKMGTAINTNIQPTPIIKQPVKKINAAEGAAGIFLNLDFESGFRGMYSAQQISNPFVSKQEKQKQIQALYKAYKSGEQQYQPYKEDKMRILTSPAAISIYSLPIGYGFGAGLGALGKVAPITEKVASGLLGGYAAYSTGAGAYETYQSKGSMINYAGGVGTQFALGIPGFKAGYKQIGGRVEQFLYSRKTFEKGSPGSIRFNAAIKASRQLEGIKPIKQEPLNLKNVERLTPKSRAAVENFLDYNRKTVIGGSSAAKTQVENARIPRDIDILIQGRGGIRGVLKSIPEAVNTKRNPLSIANERQVSIAKQQFGDMLKTDEGMHAIDIHGKEMYDPGKVLQFGFESKTPRNIGEYKYMKSGEQLFRKGIAASTKETEYRWFKDVPDFLDIGNSQVKSGRQSMNPITRFKASVGEKALNVFEKNVNKDLLRSTEGIKTSPDKGIKDFIMLSETKGYGGAYKNPYISGYKSSYGGSYKNPYRPSYKSSYKNPYKFPYKSSYKGSSSKYPKIPKYVAPYIPSSPKIPSYSPPYHPPPSYKPPSDSPPSYKPPYYKPPSYNPPYYNPPSTPVYPPRRGKIIPFYGESEGNVQYATKYKFREFKVGDLFKL